MQRTNKTEFLAFEGNWNFTEVLLKKSIKQTNTHHDSIMGQIRINTINCHVTKVDIEDSI